MRLVLAILDVHDQRPPQLAGEPGGLGPASHCRGKREREQTLALTLTAGEHRQGAVDRQPVDAPLDWRGLLLDHPDHVEQLKVPAPRRASPLRPRVLMAGSTTAEAEPVV